MQKKLDPKKSVFLKEEIKHFNLQSFNPVSLVESYGSMAFQARNIHRASKIFEMMIEEKDGAVILCLAGSLVSAGLKNIFYTMVKEGMVDAIVSTGANIVDQDFFEGLGFKHYIGSPFVNDHELRELAIDRIYDTYIDEDDLRICDDTIAQIANNIPPKAYSSREFIKEMGAYLAKNGKNKESIVLAAYENDVPIFCPAFSDCSAGFGLVHHQWNRPGEHCSIDSAKDFLELTKIKLASKTTGLFMVGGGVPKNFAQDIVVAAEVLGFEAPMHKYAVQITVADERDGGLSGSTLKEACSWGKVDTAYEQMVYAEATAVLPLIAGYAYHKGAHKNRKARNYTKVIEDTSRK